MKRGLQYAGLGVTLLLIAGMIAPFIRVDQYREQIRQGLQRALHRKVDIYGDTRLNLFRGPGFSVEKVVIHDDPSVGLEPFANVPELQASVRLSSLWTGELDFATVRFVEPSVNIVKPAAGAWNIAPLLAGATAQQPIRVPEIRVSNGRLNFKFGDTKSAFYLMNADVVLSPSQGGVDIRFALAPARTDRAAQGYGLFSGRGRWAGGNIDMNLQLEKSSLDELVTVARGQSLGLHGEISSTAKLSGPVGNVGLTGRFDLEDVHRWDLIEGRTGGLTMNYQGRLDFGSQRLDLYAGKNTNPNLPLEVKLVVAEILYNPNWSAELAMSGVAASSLVQLARHMGAPIPDAITVAEGEAAGVIGYGSTAGVQGQISIENTTVRLDRGPEFRLPSASVLLSGDEMRLLPATLSGPSRDAQLEATYAPFRQHLDARISGRGLPISDLQDGRGHLLNGAGIPILNRFKGGIWTGTVAYASDVDAPGRWAADLHIAKTSCAVPGIANALEIEEADVRLNGARLSVARLRGAVGKIELNGDYAYNPDSERPHKFSLTLPSAELTELERVLMPTLHRDSNFLARTLRLRAAAAPEWLRTRRADGILRIGTLTVAEQHLRGVRARIAWNGVAVQIPVLEGRWDQSAIRGGLTAELGVGGPVYAFRGVLTNFDWQGGSADIDGTFETKGTGQELLANLSASGKYQAHYLLVGPDVSLKGATGTFDLAATRTGPQLKLSVLQVSVGTERFSGEGATQADGRLHMDLASTSRAMRLAGPLLPLKLEVLNEGASR